MFYRSGMILALSALLFVTVGSRSARADEVLYDGSGFVQGSQSFNQTFDLTTAGTLTVTLTNVAWPQQLASLNLLVSSPSASLGPEMGAGTSIFSVGAGDVFAQWFGTAQGPLNAGVYSVRISFSPNPVPLPTSIALLLSGLVLLLCQRKSRTEVRGAMRAA